jgi:hypothetical protein
VWQSALVVQKLLEAAVVATRIGRALLRDLHQLGEEPVLVAFHFLPL